MTLRSGDLAVVQSPTGGRSVHFFFYDASEDPISSEVDCGEVVIVDSREPIGSYVRAIVGGRHAWTSSSNLAPFRAREAK